MDSGLQELIEAFESETAQALSLFLKRAGLAHPFDCRDAGLARSGILVGKPKIRYRYHGKGLWLQIGSKTLDFDFGFDGRTGGFNAWWLSQFAEGEATRFGRFLDQEYLERKLTEARATGEIGPVFKDNQDDLEYRILTS